MRSASRADREHILAELYAEMHAEARALDPNLQPRQVHPRALDSELVLVGQGLAEGTQRLSGFPYVRPDGSLSPGGHELDRFLAKCGYTIDPHATDRRYAYHMDLVLRFPGRRAGGRGDNIPSDAEVAAGWMWVERELELLAPRVVVALGAEPARHLLRRFAGQHVARTARLQPLTMRRHAATVAGRPTPLLVVYHPSGACYHPDEAPAAYDWAAAEIRAILRDA